MPGPTLRIDVLPSGEAVSCPPGEPLLGRLRKTGLFLDASCGGEGRCGRCGFEPVQGEFSPPDDSELRLDRRLLCRASALTDGSIRLRPSSRQEAWLPHAPRAAPPGDLFVAVDLGTTTLSVAASGREGEPFAEVRAVNPQVAWGSDVLRRLAAASDPGERAALKERVRNAVNSLLVRLLRTAGFTPDRVKVVGVAGNSAMAQLFLGLDPRSLSVAPFRSSIEPMSVLALDPAVFGLGSPCRAFMVPGIGSFVGGDVTAGLLACDLHRGLRPALFLDAGTNGEIVLAPAEGPLLAASGAAGPAFEGGHLSMGGPGSKGAVWGGGVNRDGSVTLRVLGEGPPGWICGSGVLELTAGMVEAGILRADGRFSDGAPGVTKEGGENGFDLGPTASGRLRFLQSDVREVQLAIGALRATWRTLLDRAGLEADDLERIVVTGTFGKALDGVAAKRVGLLPSVPVEVEALPSGAIRGILKAAAEPEERPPWESIVLDARHVPLGDAGFQDVFIDSLALRPHPR
ncbi:MAG: ASKHA domain-containing protein [Planctomycetota bacterium]